MSFRNPVLSNCKKKNSRVVNFWVNWHLTNVGPTRRQYYSAHTEQVPYLSQEAVVLAYSLQLMGIKMETPDCPDVPGIPAAWPVKSVGMGT